MADEKYKPSAKCKHYFQCFLYNCSVLTKEVEQKMCKQGKRVDANYTPRTPEPKEFTPSEGYAFLDRTGPCDAYENYEKSKLIAKLRDQVSNMKDAIDEQGFW